MLKILNNDKFTTAQNRHSLVSLKIPILNTLPERAASPERPGRCPGSGLVGLSARAGPQTRFFPHNLHQFNISILNTLPLGLDAYRNVFREIDMFGEESASKEEL